jgi:crotonobetainyl-CoA:carnitine CoA-transferase CaiB-like acyl-CoA transferase
MSDSAVSPSGGPLAGIRVVDFRSLLPSPLCSLMLATAGADVKVVERPWRSTRSRPEVPKFGAADVNFALLHQGKDRVMLDLKSESGRREALALTSSADVLIEQFRPGVMARLGLDPETLRPCNPKFIHCAITG